MTLYALLDVPEDASAEEIKRAYRDAARACHPDVNPGAEPGRFARVSEAHETLSAETKRATYDVQNVNAAKRHSTSETLTVDFEAKKRIYDVPMHKRKYTYVGK